MWPPHIVLLISWLGPAAVAMALLVHQRRQWQVASRRLAAAQFCSVRPDWLAVASITTAAASCGLAAFLAAGGRMGEPASIVLLVDVSKSMFATDIAPSRFERARALLLDFADRTDARLSVVAFAGEARLLCPPTQDDEAVRTALRTLTAMSVTAPGTAMGDGLSAAIEALTEERGRRAVLLVSDGEDQGGAVEGPLAHASDLGIALYALGVGTTSGGMVPKSAEDAPHISRLDELRLRDIAARGHGAYFRASSLDGATGIDLDAAAGATETRRQQIRRMLSHPSAPRSLMLVALTCLIGEGLRRNSS